MANDIELTEPDTSIRTYVLRTGRMTEAQRAALSALGERYILPFGAAGGDAASGASGGSAALEAPRRIEYRAAFGNANPVICEIGFGMGLATWKIAQDHPDLNYLGIEVHTPGVGKLILELEARKISNVRILHHDAVEALEAGIPPSSLAGFHIFYPDPWPKKRHHKRRLIRPGLAELLASRLAPGGYLYFVTDIEDYAHWSLEVLSGIPSLRNRYEGFAPRQDWRPETKFEAHASRDGRGAFELIFERK